jgi:type 1 fimbria pilin
MKKSFLTLFLLLAIGVLSASACNIKFTLQGNQKNCHAGDTVTVNVELTLIHRSCSVAADQTKFKVDGAKVVSASKWKQTSATTYTRTVKMVVAKDNKKNVVLTATRTCDKEGGHGTFSLPKA